MLSTPKAKAELYLASSLYDGLEDNNIMQVTTLLLNKEADPNVLIPSQGITPFHLVIGNDSETFAEEVTKLFLRHGGNPNVKSVDGMTPVHVAAAWGRLGVLELLLSNGGDPLLIDNDGRCPFHYAFDEAHYDAVATLGKYCGESFEEDSDPKYNIALDKILVSNGSVVAEYAVSEDKFAMTTGDIPAICTSQISNNNNDLSDNLNKKFGHAAKAINDIPEWRAKCPANIDLTITTTTDESSNSNFVNVRRHRKCLPRKNPKYIDHKLKTENKFKREDENLPKESICVWGTGTDNGFSTSHLNDPVIEASFRVEPRRVGENMPRVSSPKSDEKSIKLDYDIRTEYRDIVLTKTTPRDNKKASSKSKFVHKTPLRSCSKKVPLVDMKRTTAAVSAKKICNPNSKTTPNNRIYSSNENRALIHTPNKYTSKKSSYSPNCSIVSKSPNLILVPLTPTNNSKLREDRRISISSTLKRIPTFGTNYKTPTPNKICNSKNGGKSFSRFVKQSDLRHQDMKMTPTSSPSRFPGSPTWSKKSTRTPNLTDSAKQKKKCSTDKTRTPFTPLYSKTRLPPTPLNKTYSKNNYFDAVSLSPDIETTNRFVNRRSSAKNIAIKLEGTMYDDDCDANVMINDSEKIATSTGIVTLNQGTAKNMIKSKYPIAVKPKISTLTDSRLNCLNERINLDHLISKKRVEISGVNKITDSAMVGEDETPGIHLSQSDKDARGSTIIAGFFQPDDSDANSARTNNTNEIVNNVLIPRSHRPYSEILAGNLPRIENTANSATGEYCDLNLANIVKEQSDEAVTLDTCLHRPNSKEIDDSVISSELSSCFPENHTVDPTGSLNCRDTRLAIVQGASINDESTHRNNVMKTEFLPPLLFSEIHSTENGKTCSYLSNFSSSVNTSSYASFISVEEEYKYEDAEEGVVLLERRFLITPVSIPIIKAEDGVASSSAKSSQCLDDESMQSCVSSLPHSFVIMDSETLRRELTKLDGRPPGPITATTRHVYLKRLRKLKKYGPASSSLSTAVQPKFSAEIERTLRSESWLVDLSPYETLEQQVFSEFSNPNPTRRWREGTIKSSFNYLLMDPRITDNLPRRVDILSTNECWRTFLSSIFYIGKGRRSRPYAHLYEAYGEWKKGNRETSDKKINYILDIWKSNHGVVCLHFFQNTIPVEAYTREAAMIEALGLSRLKNLKSGDYYGVAATWSHHQKRTLGVYLLHRAMHILINEGERQLSPDDIGR